MQIKCWSWLVAGLLTFATVVRAGDTDSRLGVGANYWVTIDNLDANNVDDHGFSFLGTYQYWPSLLGLELDFEVLPDRFGEDAYAPEAYVLVGGMLYVAGGVGIIYQNSEWAQDPFYAIRAGLNLELLPSFFLDINANYRFNDTTQFKDNSTDIDTDTVFIGAAARIGF